MRSSKLGIAGILFWGIVCSAQSGGSAASPGGLVNDSKEDNICRVYFAKARPGMEEQLEAGRKKHMAFHRAHKDTWRWDTFVIATGHSTGKYVTRSCGHSWKDFDEWESRMAAADTVDANLNLIPYQQTSTNSFYRYREDISLAPGNQPVTLPMMAITVYELRPGAAPGFIAAEKKITDAMRRQADWPKTSGWIELINGGESPTFELLNSRRGWTDFEPLPKSIQEVMEEAYGKQVSDQVQKDIRDNTVHVYTVTSVHRPDLSYVPEK